MTEQKKMESRQDAEAINIIFDGPPGPEAGRFVEIETDDGKSLNVGEWIEKSGGMWALRITKSPRPRIGGEAIGNAIADLMNCLKIRLTQKGDGAFASPHEVFGVVIEEVLELLLAILNNNPEAVRRELLDIAVACVFGVACINEKAMDW
jgi:NTP pyrophosphatase (non-canonical NTP hydrolase)